MKVFRSLAICLAIGLAVLTQTSSQAASSSEKLSKADARSLAASATTRAEHTRLAVYYKAESLRYAAEAQDHAKLEQQYKNNPMMNNNKRFQGTVDHCDYIAKSLNEASAQSLEMAKMHEAMASDASK